MNGKDKNSEYFFKIDFKNSFNDKKERNLKSNTIDYELLPKNNFNKTFKKVYSIILNERWFKQGSKLTRSKNKRKSNLGRSFNRYNLYTSD